MTFATPPPLDNGIILPQIAPVEQIAGNERFVLKAWNLQRQHQTPSGKSFVDVTIDLEDGAPVGAEESWRKRTVELLNSPQNCFQQSGVRVHPRNSPHWESDLTELVSGASEKIAYITLPKVEGSSDVLATLEIINDALRKAGGVKQSIPLHVLIETSSSVKEVSQIAQIPDVQVLDFGLMDYISHLGGAISSECMQSPGQFEHRLLALTKTELVRAALSAGKIPSHNVTVTVREPEQAYRDAFRARTEFGFLRMWSIHPTQVEPILKAMLPSEKELKSATEILDKGRAADWGPIEHGGRLHDRASYRYYWQVTQRSFG